MARNEPKSGKSPRYELAAEPDVDLAREDVRDRQGRRITQEYVEQAVAGVHASNRGRPSLTGQRARSPQVTFRLSPELRALAEAQAKREGKRVSEVAREALEAYLSNQRAS